MAWVINRPNFLNPADRKVVYTPAKTLREAVMRTFPETAKSPTVFSVNGLPRLRKHWDEPLPAGAVVTADAVPNGLETALVAVSVTLTVASLLTTAWMIYNQPSISNIPGIGVTPEPDPVFSFGGQKNAQRLNNVIETVYGRNRWWPAYLCNPRVQYADNVPVLDVWLSLGHGDFDIEDVRVGDTSLSSIPGCSWEYYAPGHTITTDQTPDIVQYAKDVRNTDLRGPNEDKFAVLGPYTPIAAPLASRQFCVNFAYTSGLFTANGDGDLFNKTVEVEVQALNQSGTSVYAGTIEHTAKTVTPLRLSFVSQVYDASIGTNVGVTLERLTNIVDTSNNDRDRVVVESVQAYNWSGRQHNVALLHVRLTGSDTLGSDAAEKINVVATRKLRTLVDGVWTAPTPTRNPVYAFMDAMQATYGGQVPDDNFDLALWEELAKTVSGKTFDHVFGEKTTVWDAARAIGQSIRAVPYVAGSDIRLFVDSPVDQPVALFSPDNVTDLKWSVGFAKPLDADCIEAAYVDPDTGLQDVVQFTPPGSEGVTPKRVTFAGVTDRDEAWRLAAYSYYKQVLQRETVSFTTGLEGHIPMYGDVIMVSWPFPAWGTAGVVTQYELSLGLLAVSEPLTFGEGSYWLALRTKAGRVFGPLEVESTEDPYVVSVAADLSAWDFSGEVEDQVLFTFGPASQFARLFRVDSTTPNGSTVSVKASAFVPEVFAYDALSAPPRGSDLEPVAPSPDGVPWITVAEESGDYLRVQWGPAMGATGYVVEYDYATRNVDTMRKPWDAVGTAIVLSEVDVVNLSAYVPRQDGDLYIRVTATGSGTYREWWRGLIGPYPGSTNRPLSLRLVNNANGGYVGPLDPGNTATEDAHAVIGSSIAATFDTALLTPTVYGDAPAGRGVWYELDAGTVENGVAGTVKVFMPNGGPHTFTQPEMRAAGLERCAAVGGLVLTARSYPDGTPSEAIAFQINAQALTGTHTLSKAVVDSDLDGVSVFKVTSTTTVPGVARRRWEVDGSVAYAPTVVPTREVRVFNRLYATIDQANSYYAAGKAYVKVTDLYPFPTYNLSAFPTVRLVITDANLVGVLGGTSARLLVAAFSVGNPRLGYVTWMDDIGGGFYDYPDLSQAEWDAISEAGVFAALGSVPHGQTVTLNCWLEDFFGRPWEQEPLTLLS
jgi:hypothetical protein